MRNFGANRAKKQAILASFMALCGKTVPFANVMHKYSAVILAILVHNDNYDLFFACFAGVPDAVRCRVPPFWRGLKY